MQKRCRVRKFSWRGSVFYVCYMRLCSRLPSQESASMQLADGRLNRNRKNIGHLVQDGNESAPMPAAVAASAFRNVRVQRRLRPHHGRDIGSPCRSVPFRHRPFSAYDPQGYGLYNLIPAADRKQAARLSMQHDFIGPADEKRAVCRPIFPAAAKEPRRVLIVHPQQPCQFGQAVDGIGLVISNSGRPSLPGAIS